MLRKLFWFLFKMVILIILPFIILIRGSVYFHTKHHFFPYISITAGVVITTILLILYFTIFYQMTLKKYYRGIGLKRKAIIACFVVFGYCIHALFFISTKNLQSSSLSREIGDLHPILRLATSTIIMLDKDLVITDASRVPEDYRRMGLKTNNSSLHYRQKDGYAYALDLHTSRRSEIRNFLLKSYFSLMGFNTLRHVGTGDHLHISLKCKYKPGGI